MCWIIEQIGEFFYVEWGRERGLPPPPEEAEACTLSRPTSGKVMVCGSLLEEGGEASGEMGGVSSYAALTFDPVRFQRLSGILCVAFTFS